LFPPWNSLAVQPSKNTTHYLVQHNTMNNLSLLSKRLVATATTAVQSHPVISQLTSLRFRHNIRWRLESFFPVSRRRFRIGSYRPSSNDAKK
jgi:hypothetical protein